MLHHDITRRRVLAGTTLLELYACEEEFTVSIGIRSAVAAKIMRVSLKKESSSSGDLFVRPSFSQGCIRYFDLFF
jgi:hypothetical protein